MSANQISKTRASCHLIACLFCALLLMNLGCERASEELAKSAADQAPHETSASFETLFKQNCSGCHGREGKLGPAPPLNDPLFLTMVPAETLLETITNGRPGTPMPAFDRQHGGQLTTEQIQILAAGLKSQWEGKGTPLENVPSYLADAAPDANSAGNVERGETLFATACANCHGANGTGTGEGELPGAINDSDFLSLISNQTLRRIIITGRHDLGMPNFSGTDGRDADFKPLTPADVADLVALLVHWRSASTGEAAPTATATARD